MPGASFSGTVTRSTLALDPSTRSFLVEVDLPNPDQSCVPARLLRSPLASRNSHALVLPPQAINSGSKGQSLFIVEQGKAKAVPIHTGIRDGQWIEITDGLRGDEDVVVVGKRQLLDQSPVHASPFQLPEAKPAQQKFERRSAGVHPSAWGPTLNRRVKP